MVICKIAQMVIKIIGGTALVRKAGKNPIQKDGLIKLAIAA
jgi:hypothetical protein